MFKTAEKSFVTQLPSAPTILRKFLISNTRFRFGFISQLNLMLTHFGIYRKVKALLKWLMPRPHILTEQSWKRRAAKVTGKSWDRSPAVSLRSHFLVRVQTLRGALEELASQHRSVQPKVVSSRNKKKLSSSPGHKSQNGKYSAVLVPRWNLGTSY